MQEFKIDLAPARVADVKQGRHHFAHPEFADVKPLQMSLFAYELNKRTLVDHFSEAVRVLRRAEQRAKAWNSLETTELAVQLLGLMVLADTGALGERTRVNRVGLSLEALWDRARDNDSFRRYFHDYPTLAASAARDALQVLGAVSYAGFNEEYIIDLYRAAYTKEQRRDLGRFDTPLWLTQKIWEQIPVELLEPSARTVCDMTSGWGSFLVSGRRRLGRLVDMKGIPLQSLLHGNDLSESAAALSRFGLLLSTLDDSWHVDNEDAMTWSWLNVNRPNIIVGNPPFGGDRKTLELRSKRWQEADQFMSRAIDRLAPEGFLAMIMPRNFAVAEASPALRRQLLKECDVLEIWELPVQVFAPEASARTSVVFAQKRAAPSIRSYVSTVIRTVQPETFEDFRHRGAFTRSVVVPEQNAWLTSEGAKAQTARADSLIYSFVLAPLEWQQLRSRCVTLENRAAVFAGCIEGDPSKRRARPGEKNRPVEFLTGKKETSPKPWVIDDSTRRTVQYPAGFQWPRSDKEPYLRGEKVLVAKVIEPRWGKQTKVAIERRGRFVSDNFWIVAATSSALAANVTSEVIAAVLDSVVANAWVVDQIRTTSLDGDTLKSVPFPPNITAADRDAITHAIRQIEAAAQLGAAEPIAARKSVDEILQRLYEVEDATWQRMESVAAWNSSSARLLDDVAASTGTVIVDGVVDAVDPERGEIDLWLSGFPRIQRIRVEGHVPGWMLKEGVPFRTSVLRGAWSSKRLRRASDFGALQVMPYAYLDEDELVAAIRKSQTYDEQ